MRNQNLPIAVCGISVGRERTTVTPFDLKWDTTQRFSGNAVQFGNEDRAVWCVSEFQSNRLTSFDGNSLRGLIQFIALFGFQLFDHKSGSRGKILNENGARTVSDKFTIGVANHGSLTGGHLEGDITEGFFGHRIYLLNEQIAFGAVSKIKLYHILGLTGQVDSLRCSVYHMPIWTFQLLNHISASLQSSNGKTAIDSSLIGSNNSTTTARSTTQIFYLKYGTFQGFTSDRVKFVHYQSRQRSILKEHFYCLVMFHIDDFFCRILQSIARRRFYLHNFVPTSVQILKFNDSSCIGYIIVLF